MKRDKQADEAAVVDMNDTLMDYAHKRQPHVDDLAEELAKRAKDNINAIDDYLKMMVRRVKVSGDCHRLFA